MCNTLKYIEMCDYKFTYIYIHIYMKPQKGYICALTYVCAYPNRTHLYVNQMQSISGQLGHK